MYVFQPWGPLTLFLLVSRTPTASDDAALANASLSTQPEELSKRMAILYAASLVSGAFGGLLGGVITDYLDGVANTPGWQW